MPEHRTVILFSSHFISSPVTHELLKLERSCAGNYEVVFLYDNTRGDFKPAAKGKYHLFTLESIAAAGYPLDKNVSPAENLWHHCDYPVLDYYLKNSAFDYYWKVEFDVRFVGEWSDFFDRFAHDESDFLATEIKTYHSSPRWFWWDRLTPRVPLDRQVGCFFPVTRFSRNALQVVHQAYRSGAEGHCEVVVPTILKNAGLSINDLGDKSYDRSTFGWDRYYRIKKGYLHHPVKNKRLGWVLTSALPVFVDNLKRKIMLRARIRKALKIVSRWIRR
ncbi:MAG: DUF3405 domain-containing protein [Candidatus Omnitrophota bacterium]